MADLEPTARGELLPSSTPAFSIRHRKRVVNVYQVTDQEIDALRNASPAIWWTFFGLAIGAAIAFGTVAFSQTESAPNHDLWVALFWPSAVLSAFFLTMSIRYQAASNRLASDIKTGA